MSQPFIWAHLIAALIALPLSAVMLLRPKGDRLHKLLGRLWVAAMVVTSVTSFWIAEINDGRWSPIHILSIVTLVGLAAALYAIRNGRVKNHRSGMIATCIGLYTAFVFALAPGRFIMGQLGF